MVSSSTNNGGLADRETLNIPYGPCFPYCSQPSFSSSSSSYSHFYVRSTCDDIRRHVARSHSSTADSPFHHFVGTPPIRPSSLPSTLYFDFHRPPSYVVLLSSRHMPIPLQPPFLDFISDSTLFRCPLILAARWYCKQPSKDYLGLILNMLGTILPPSCIA